MSNLLVGLLEVLLGVDGVSLDGIGALLPVGGADLTVLLSELESVNESEGLLNGSADRQIVDGDLSDGSLGVNDEDTSESNTGLGDQHTVVLGQGVVGVSEERDVDGAKTTVLSGNVGPGEERVLGVGGGKEDLGVSLLELRGGIGVGDDLGGAHKGESERDEGEDNPLTLELLKGDILEDTVDNGGLLEGGGGVLNSGDHCVCVCVIGSITGLETEGTRPIYIAQPST